MKKIIILCLMLFLIFSLISCKEEKQQFIKIGSILPLTGEGTTDQGVASKQAIQMAVHEINELGGINGKNLKVIFEDSQCDAKKGVTAIEKLINIDNVDFIIGDICDSVTAAIIPIAENSKKILVTPGSTSPDISDAGDFIFRFWFSENDLGGMAAEKAFEMGFHKLAILYINNAWGVAQKNSVSKRFKDLGREIVSEQAIEPSNNDYKTVLLKAETNEPDAYYIGLHPNGLALSTKQMKELKINKQIFSHGGLVGSTQVLGLGGNHLEGIIAPFVYNPSEEFVEKFKKKYGAEPGITADSSYDIVKVIAQIMKQTGKTDSETIKNGLYNIKKYEGVSGEISVDEKGDTHRLLNLMTVKEGKLILIF